MMPCYQPSARCHAAPDPPVPPKEMAPPAPIVRLQSKQQQSTARSAVYLSSKSAPSRRLRRFPYLNALNATASHRGVTT